MAAQKQKDSTRQWISDEQLVHETTEYGANQRAVGDALAEQRRRTKLVADYGAEVQKTIKHIDDDSDKSKLNTAYHNLDAVANKKLHCLEGIAQIAGLEELFGNVSAELAERATSLVEDVTRDKAIMPDSSGDSIARSSQDCILAVRNNWAWISKLVRCTDIHLKNVSEYHQFFHEVKEYEEWLPIELQKAQRLVTDSDLKGTKQDAGRLLVELKTVLSIFLHWQGKADRLFERAGKIVPVHHRSRKLDHPRPITALCNYRTNDISIQEGEDLTLLDNTMAQSWQVRNNRDYESFVPSIICLIPPPDPAAVTYALRLRLQLLGIWTLNVKRVGKTLIKFLLMVFREWTKEEEEVLKALPDDQKKEISRMCDFIESALLPYWAEFPPFKRLQGRLNHTRDLLKQKGDPKYINSEMGRALIVQIGVVEELLKRYKDFWSYWETYKILVAACRHSELILICDKWEELKFVSTLELMKKWHIGLEFDESELREEIEEVIKEEIIETVEATVTEAVNGVTEEETTYNFETQKETAETDQYSVAEQEEKKTFVITGVIDPRTDEEVSLDKAVMLGIINQATGTYNNPRTGESLPIPVAMNAGKIKVEFVSTKKSAEKRRDVGLITIKTEKESRPYTVKGVLEPNSDRQLSVDQAISEGILDMKNSIYRNKDESTELSLADALDSGLLIVDFDKGASVTEPEVITKTYAIYAVIDQRQKKRVPFGDAVRQGLFDPDTGMYHNNKLKEDMYVVDAIKKGHIKASVVKDPQSMDIPKENKIVLDRMQTVKDKLMKPMKALSALKRASAKEDGQ